MTGKLLNNYRQDNIEESIRNRVLKNTTSTIWSRITHSVYNRTWRILRDNINYPIRNTVTVMVIKGNIL